MRLHACVLMLLLVGSSVAVAADRKADEVDFLTELVAMRALVRAGEIGGYEAFHLAVTRAAGRPFGVKKELEHFGSGGGRITYEEAVADWEALARDGDPNAMSNLAVMYDLGLGVAPDPARAVELYRAAADRGSVVAQNNLGIAYALGRGVGRDRAQALQWLGAAGKKGLVLAEKTLGVLYLMAGDERSAAVRLSRAVARRGFDAARLNLARLYEAKADDLGFDEWFWDTAVAGATGWPPVPAEPLAAYSWFDRAAEAGFPAAERKRDLAEAAERASTARWSPLFSPSEHLLREKKWVERISSGLCRSYEHNRLDRLRKILKRSGERSLGWEVPLERAYMYIKCYQPGLGDVDLLRVSAENPIGTSKAAKDLIHFFTDELQDKFLLGKILMCRREFGYGCVNLFEHIEVNKKMFARLPKKLRALKIFEWRLRRAVDNEHLKRHVGLCRTFLKEPEHCGN